MDWMLLLDDFHLWLRDFAFATASAGRDELAKSHVTSGKLVATYEELDSPFQLACRARFTAMSPRVALQLIAFVEQRAEAAGRQTDRLSAQFPPEAVVAQSSHAAVSDIDVTSTVVVSWMSRFHDGAVTVEVKQAAARAAATLTAPSGISVRRRNGRYLHLYAESLSDTVYHVWGFDTSMHPSSMAETVDKVLR